MVLFEVRVYLEERAHSPSAVVHELNAVIYLYDTSKPLVDRFMFKEFTVIRTYSLEGILTPSQLDVRRRIEAAAAMKHVEAWIPGTCPHNGLATLPPMAVPELGFWLASVENATKDSS